ncbi:MAG: homoserine O-succinyltransferase [Planctomycetales bacterium]|nr:homoserine O-succinyltransferase [Planctomycetales bacterium]
MPLVAHIPLPTFDDLRERGENVLELGQALQQDIRELHIGLLNMMPDAALTTTERQFMRLVGSSNQIAQLFVYPFSIPGLPRGAEAQAYIDHYYIPFEQIQRDGLDALIITGANVANPMLEQEPFWEALHAIAHWASEHVTSVLCSCLATHAMVKAIHGIERRPLPSKRWGVYPHRIAAIDHPLLRDINTRFDVPHSRFNDVSREQMEAAGLTILAAGEESAVHLAVSPDQFRIVYFQGHPEYDGNSLLKEYKREVARFGAGERDDYPPHLDNYFSSEAAAIIDAYEATVRTCLEQNLEIPPFPDDQIEPHLDNTWLDTGKSIVNNWLGTVYRLTSLDRKIPFAVGVDPQDPLGLRK